MAGTPYFKVYTPDGRYMAACKEAEGAACLACLYGIGSTVRDKWHKKVLLTVTEGTDNSWDVAAQQIIKADES